VVKGDMDGHGTDPLFGICHANPAAPHYLGFL
jgi:hypothetical protein